MSDKLTNNRIGKPFESKAGWSLGICFISSATCSCVFVENGHPIYLFFIMMVYY
jgi:hypothetical protein